MMELEDGSLGFPTGWAWTKIGDICDLVNGRAFKAENWASTGLPIIRIQNLNNLNAEFNFCNFDVEEKYLVDNGQLLFAWSGTPGTSFGAHIWNRGRGVLNQHIFKVNINEKYLDKKFLMHVINYNVSQYIKKAHGTAGLAHITKSKFESSLIPLPPFNEQSRIAEKIEELFSNLDAGIQALKNAQAQLKRYRQAVLKAAVEGRLTEEWRKAHPEIEPVEALHDRILRLKQKKMGKSPKGSQVLDATGMPEIPESWLWVRLDSLAALKGGITKDAKRQVNDGQKVPYLRVANVQRGYLDLNEIKEIEASVDIISELRLECDDILFNEGGDRDKLGRGWIWQGELPECIHQNHVFRARLYLSEVSNKLISWFGNTYGQKYFLKEGKQTTNLASVNLTKLSAFPVPLPPIEEQKAIVEAIESYLSISGELMESIDQNLKHADNLRQSILKRAFEGRLVPQDPTDEPAEILLERIKAERDLMKPNRRSHPRDTRNRRIKKQNKSLEEYHDHSH